MEGNKFSAEIMDQAEGLGKIKNAMDRLRIEMALYEILAVFCASHRFHYNTALNEHGVIVPEPTCPSGDDLLGSLLGGARHFNARSREMYARIQESGFIKELYENPEFKSLIESPEAKKLELGYGWILAPQFVTPVSEQQQDSRNEVGKALKN